LTPALDVLIVTYNTKDDVLRCLASLFAHPPRALGAVMVVDNASGDGTAAAVEAAWPAVRVMALDRNVGFAAANNRAIAATSSPLTLLLNSDTVVPPGALDALVDRLVANGATAAGPRLVDGEGRPEVSFGSQLWPGAELVQQGRVRIAGFRGRLARAYVKRLVGRERAVDWVSGACLLVRREAALGAGLLDERYFMYEEDVDFCAALRARGGRIVFTPRATVTHLRGRSAQPAPDAVRAYYDQSHLAFYEKHAPGWVPWLRWWLRLRGRTPR
jgi:N-acetylglucosaminyl-diphospho-decaprenol L-rhamnosyltransferase